MRSHWQTRAAEYFQQLQRPRRLKHYRCGCCGSRRSLRRELWEYSRPPSCRNCHGNHWYIDMSRTREWRARRGVFSTCHCSGMPYPHRWGSTGELYQCIRAPFRRQDLAFIVRLAANG